MVVYITVQGSKILREGKRLIVKKGTDIHHTIFIHKLEQLILCGKISLTPPAISLLFKEGIDTVFLRSDGRYIGRLGLEEPKNVFLRRLQFLLCQEPEFCLPAAKAMITGKLANMATLLMRIRRTRRAKSAGEAAQRIRDTLAGLRRAKDLDSLRGYEGQASAVYFRSLQSGFKRDWGFRKRIRRPPTDPVNAVLSRLYTFLINRVYAAVRIAGLDPYPGVLHSLEYGRFSLVLDLAEEFRPILADSLALAFFNLEILQEKDFHVISQSKSTLIKPEEDKISKLCQDHFGSINDNLICETSDLECPQITNVTPEEMFRNGKPSVKLRPAAFRKVIEGFERKLSTEFHYSASNENITYSKALVMQARQFRRLIEGEIVEYRPLLLR